MPCRTFVYARDQAETGPGPLGEAKLPQRSPDTRVRDAQVHAVETSRRHYRVF